MKSCSAHLLAACLRHAESSVLEIVGDFFAADDRLLASRYVRDLIVYLSYRDIGIVEALTMRMLASNHAAVRRAAGQLTAFLGLEHGRAVLLTAASTSADMEVRRGVAEVAAARLARGSRLAENHALLVDLFSDEASEVREAAANVGMNLWEHALRPYADTLTSLIASPAFRSSLPQLFLTLQYAPDRVHDLIVLVARRFIDELGAEAVDMSTSAAGDAHYLGELVLRAYVQAGNASERKQALDLVDGLIQVGAYGMEDLLNKSDRAV